MQNVNAASRLKPRLMSVVLTAIKELKTKKINFTLQVEKGVDFRAKILALENGKPVPSEKINEIVSEVCKRKNYSDFDGEFIRLKENTNESEEKKSEKVIEVFDESEKSDETENEGVSEEKVLKKKKKKKTE